MGKIRAVTTDSLEVLVEGTVYEVADWAEKYLRWDHENGMYVYEDAAGPHFVDYERVE